MENMAPVAGMASSLQGVSGTIIAAFGGFAIGQSFDGTQLPFLWGLSLCGALGLSLVVLTDPRRMFEQLAPAHDPAGSAPVPRAG